VLVVEHIRRLLGRRELAGAELVVDRTGCGRPVVDLMRAEGLRPIAVTITSGSAARQEGRDHWLPKADLIGGLQVLVQSRRLLIAEALPLTRDLVRELTAFTTTIRLAGEAGEAPLWREQAHDDLVLAVALGAWWAGRGLGGAAAF
jgi:hypothetical protein